MTIFEGSSTLNENLNKTRAIGPNPELQKGPNIELILTKREVSKGPNPDFRQGPSNLQRGPDIKNYTGPCIFTKGSTHQRIVNEDQTSISRKRIHQQDEEQLRQQEHQQEQ